MECETCGTYFDPIATRWLCPRCHTKWDCCMGAPLPARDPQPCTVYAAPREDHTDESQ